MLRKRLFARLYPGLSARHEALVKERKEALFARALAKTLPGRVLEVGPGPGVNLAYLPPGLVYLVLEPNPFYPLLEAAARERGVHLTLVPGSAEAIPLPEASVDLVVGTLVLCSVREPGRAVAEVRRVLRPGGVYLFVEHVAAPPSTPSRLLQGMATPLFSLLGDGCHPNRDPLPFLLEAFARVEVERLDLPLPVVGPHLMGLAWA